MNKKLFNKSAYFARIAKHSADKKEEYLFFDEEIYSNLPNCLKPFFQFSSRRQNDMFLNAILPALGLILWNTSGIYDQRKVHAILYSINCAPAASGKGVQNYVFDILDQIQAYLVEKQSGKINLQRIICPGNSSAAAIMNFLTENHLAMINETEIDVIINALNQDWGDYTTILRQNYQGERITINRVEGGYKTVKDPKLAVSFAGTNDQLIKLFKNTDNGLFSRFMIYTFDEVPSFRSVKPNYELENYEDIIMKNSINLLNILDEIYKHKINFNLSDSQWEIHQKKFDNLIKINYDKYGSTATSTITRMGLMHYRICMIFSVFRHAEEGSLSSNIICSEIDFKISGKLMNVYYTNLLKTLELIPHESKKIENNGAWQLFQVLPEDEFSTKNIKEIALKNNICSDRSVDNYLALLVREGLLDKGKKYGTFIKMTKIEKE